MADLPPTWPPDIEPLPRPDVDETWERVRQAAMDVVLEKGYHEVEVGDILERAGVTQEEFGARFAGLADCLDRTYEMNIAEFDQAMVAPYLEAPSWRQGILAAIYGAAEYLRDHRRERRYGELRKDLGGGMETAMRDRYLQRVVDLIDVGRCELDDPNSISRTTAEGVLGSIYKLLLDRLAKSGDGTVAWDVVDEVMYLALRRYVGDEEGARELAVSASERALW